VGFPDAQAKAGLPAGTATSPAPAGPIPDARVSVVAAPVVPAASVGAVQPPSGTPIPAAGAVADIVPPDRRIIVPTAPPGGPAAPQPTVTEFTSKPFFVTPDVRTFAAISRKEYGDEKYGRALWQFNQKQGFISPDVSAEAALEPNQKIIVPQVTHLQDRYAAEVRAFQPSPASSPPLPVRPSNAAAPPAAPGPAGTQVAADGSWTYRVSGNGEFLWEIARQRLGDRQRWSEIYRLNPTVQPELAIPAGTDLRMPAAARQGL
jgi:nucleoid-associated protein YgaU